ncbi:MAG TPA: class III lanthipeptide [Thermoanaerobaculia bacterium]|nr:class III lanthipeptide [Thermoanaerobaculia bacterium]
MSDNPDNKQAEEAGNAEMTELEEGDLQDVSGGNAILDLQKLEVPPTAEGEMIAGSCTSSVSTCCATQQRSDS